MDNLITVNSKETLAKGSYQTDKYIYNVEYNYADGKVTRIAITICDGATKNQIGMASYSDNNTNITMYGDGKTKDHETVLEQLHQEVIATVTTSV